MSFVSLNPTSERIEAEFPALGPSELAQLLDQAEAGARTWRARSIEDRAAVLHAVATTLRGQSEALATLMAREMGKPIGEGRAEVEKCAWTCEHFAKAAPELLRPRPVPTDATESFVVPEPLGTVLAVMPWNFPFWQFFRFAAPALLAGNTAFLKHAPNVPQCALAIEALFRQAGAPEGVVINAFAEVQTIEGIVVHPAIRAVTLTGSERAGRSVGALAGRELKKAVLELGGSDPFIVFDDADLLTTARAAVRARLVNGGQSCIAAKRFILVDGAGPGGGGGFADRFVAAMSDEMARVRIGDPLDAVTQVGPLARRDLRETLHRQVEESVRAGARLVVGGHPLDREGWFYAPTLLDHCTETTPAAAEETFGPVAAILRAADEETALRLANATPYGLGASIWTKDMRRARSWIDALQVGSVFVNGMVKSDARLPFGGVKLSGHGRELGREGFYEFVNWKTVWIGASL